MKKEILDRLFTIELKNLALGLVERGIRFQFDRLHNGYQIIAYKNGVRSWDAVCHSGSYGHELGLIEIMGDIVDAKYDDVEGYLTADDILRRIDNEKN